MLQINTSSEISSHFDKSGLGGQSHSVLSKNQLARDKDSLDTCAVPAHWDPRQWLSDVSHAYLCSEMLWLYIYLCGPEGRPEIHYKCIFCKESITQPPPWQLHRSDYFLVLCPASVYKHTQKSRLKPAKKAAHVEKCYHACLTYCHVNSLQGSQQTPVEPCGKRIKKIKSRRCLSEQVSNPLRAYQIENSFLLDWDAQNVVHSSNITSKKMDFPTRGDLQDKFKPCSYVTPAPICRPDLSFA